MAKPLDEAVSIVMVTYHTGQYLLECVAAALAQKELLELILVNNGNPPDFWQRIEALAVKEPKLKLISGHGNIGFARGCNLGALRATAPYLLLLNPDCVLHEGGLKGLIAAAKSLRRPWIIGPRLMLPNGAEQKGSRRPILTPWLCFAYVCNLQKLMPHHPYFGRLTLHENTPPLTTTEVPAISGACMMIMRADWQQLRGMDERFFLHVEDMDLCLRIQRRGGAIYFAPHVAVKHYGATSRASAVKVEAHKSLSFIRYFYKNFRGFYPFGFLTLVSVAVLLRFAILALILSFRAFLNPRKLVEKSADPMAALEH